MIQMKYQDVFVHKNIEMAPFAPGILDWYKVCFSGLKLDHRYYINLGDLQTLAVIPEILHKNKQNLPR